MNEELKKAFLDRISELFDAPVMELKIMISYSPIEVPTIEYHIKEKIVRAEASEPPKPECSTCRHLYEDYEEYEGCYECIKGIRNMYEKYKEKGKER